jgi:hypothetical protein
MRRVRSSKCGQTERNFRFNSDSVFMSAKHNAMTPRLIPLFIYTDLVSPLSAEHEAMKRQACRLHYLLDGIRPEDVA